MKQILFTLVVLQLAAAIWAAARSPHSVSAHSSAGAGGAGSSGIRAGTVTDIEGNVYRTVRIGRQEWMAENLRTTRLKATGRSTVAAMKAPWWAPW